MLDELGACPAYVVDGRMEIVAWNRMACEVFGDYGAMDEWDRNLLWRMFADKEHRRLFVNWEETARRLLAQFRIFYGKKIEDPWYNGIVSKLGQASPEFAAWWEQHEVIGISEGKKELNHPRAGRLTLEYNSFAVSEDADLLLTVFTPDLGTDTKRKLSDLRAESLPS